MLKGSAGNLYAPASMHDMIHDFITEWEDSWPLAVSLFPENLALIAQAILEGTAIMISDGSYKPLLSTKIGAAAWILQCSQTSTVCFGECLTSSLRHEINAYRFELQGYHAGWSPCTFGLLHLRCMTYTVDW
jgi:hypothetical protein